MGSLPENFTQITCEQCLQGAGLGFEFTMAFQPIVDLVKGEVFAYEALARGMNGEPAGTVLAQVTNENLYRFDQAARIKAIQLAAELGVQSRLSINFMPNAVYEPKTCIFATLEAAKRYDFPTRNLIFEVTETERVRDVGHLISIVQAYKKLGFQVALDDFGDGYAGLTLLADLQPDIVKLDISLIRDVHKDKVRQAIVRGALAVTAELGTQVIAEGIEQAAELETLQEFRHQPVPGLLLRQAGVSGTARANTENLAAGTYSDRIVLKVRLTRGPHRAVSRFMPCFQFCCVSPRITSKLPDASGIFTGFKPRFARSFRMKVRVVPKLSDAITGRAPSSGSSSL